MKLRAPAFVIFWAMVIANMVSTSKAVSPESIAIGKQLFEKTWTAQNPALGGDGLGPLFNAASCVKCHAQGGIGGSGDARFNAKSIAIEEMQLTGPNNTMEVAKEMLANFHPGFESSSGGMVNSFGISHQGGSKQYQQLRSGILSQVNAEFSSDGGPTNATEVQRALMAPILYSHNEGDYTISFRARIFQRNTTPLFGNGLIDQIPNKLLEQVAKRQESHPEISGRVATLRSGRYGRFGWRGNISSLLDFVENACVAEVGLETKRKRQPHDPTYRNYRNTAPDISDQQMIAMRDFVAALPAPVRQLPTDSEAIAEVSRGEKLFGTVGCAICHVPDMGPAKGIYSDVLLHDMGETLYDYNGAEPYIVRALPESTVTLESSRTRTTGTAMSSGYYGGQIPMEPTSIDSTSHSVGGSPSRSNRRLQRRRYPNQPINFVAPRRSTKKTDVLSLGSEKFLRTSTNSASSLASASRTLFGDFQQTTQNVFRKDTFMRLTYEITNTTQEWRTPPLWGLRDSAPYMHDGRAETVLEAIILHGGESAGTRDRFLALPLADRQAILTFLNTLVAPNVPQTNM